MKHIRVIILFILITSCGSTKKAIQSPKDNKPIENKTTTEIQPKIEVDAETDIKVIEKDIINSDSIKVETKAIPKLSKVDDIHLELNQLLEIYVSDNGNVDYEGFKSQRKDLDNYINSLTNQTPKDSWSKEETLAYWINAYNALTIDLILRNYPIKSIKDIKDPWDQRLWKFGDKWQNLNDIEHQILRKMDEPRIHFAIVCASFSCPKLQNEAFTAQNLEEQLTRATKEFLADDARNTISENELKLSKIFKWFAKDFKTEGSLIDFLNRYTEVEISSKAKKTFKDYNWDLND